MSYKLQRKLCKLHKRMKVKIYFFLKEKKNKNSYNIILKHAGYLSTNFLDLIWWQGRVCEEIAMATVSFRKSFLAVTVSN